ncbi:unnamed protein product [[Candida] boidinii]|nr:unnamed protein product [[Candida] boidinii]
MNGINNDHSNMNGDDGNDTDNVDVVYDDDGIIENDNLNKIAYNLKNNLHHVSHVNHIQVHGLLGQPDAEPGEAEYVFQ